MSKSVEGVSLNDIISGSNASEVQLPELVFGLVGPLGCNIEAAQNALIEELKKVGYESTVVHITKYVKEAIPEVAEVATETYTEKIDLMNKIVEASGAVDFLARIAIAHIVSTRISINSSRNLKDTWGQLYQIPGRAYIIRQLKRSHEVDLLRKVYGRKFIQVSVVVSDKSQHEAALNIVSHESPEKSKVDRDDVARKLVARDRDEAEIKFGQKLVNAYHSADVFVGGTTAEISEHTARFVQGFFGSNYISPTRDEVGAYLAKAASLRTLDLSRQVGAAITNSAGDIISIGCNEVPSPGGGNYWHDDPNPQRDIERGLEANKMETNRVIHDFVYALSRLEKAKFDPKDVLLDKNFDAIIKETLVSDLTEFGRMAHAEMSALADAARLGRSTKDSTIHVTTFPCHNCAKHLVAAGISRIVYIEPYLKSKAFELSGDALSAGEVVAGKVLVEHFVGISPRRFRDIFEKPNKRRNDKNQIKKWHFDDPMPMVEDKLWTHTIAEVYALGDFASKVDAVKSKLKVQQSE